MGNTQNCRPAAAKNARDCKGIGADVCGISIMYELRFQSREKIQAERKDHCPNFLINCAQMSAYSFLDYYSFYSETFYLDDKLYYSLANFKVTCE